MHRTQDGETSGLSASTCTTPDVYSVMWMQKNGSTAVNRKIPRIKKMQHLSQKQHVYGPLIERRLLFGGRKHRRAYVKMTGLLICLMHHLQAYTYTHKDTHHSFCWDSLWVNISSLYFTIHCGQREKIGHRQNHFSVCRHTKLNDCVLAESSLP